MFTGKAVKEADPQGIDIAFPGHIFPLDLFRRGVNRGAHAGVCENRFGVQHFVELAKYLDEKNPILGSRLLQVLSRWYTLAEPQRSNVFASLEALKPQVKSKNVVETLNSMLSI